MTSNMTLIDTNDRWLLKFARALEDRLSRRTPILPIDKIEVGAETRIASFSVEREH